MAETASIADPRAISRDVFSATLGSVCCCYSGQPFDTVKVRMQTNPATYPSFVATTSSIFRNEVSVGSIGSAETESSAFWLELNVCVRAGKTRELLPFGRALYRPLLEWPWKTQWPLE